MVKRVYKGLPLQLRGQAWALMLDVEKLKNENEGKYEVKEYPVSNTARAHTHALLIHQASTLNSA
jgi:hypothetical protein